MKPLEETAIFWYQRCKEANNCGECFRKHHCKWAREVILRNGRENSDEKND